MDDVRKSLRKHCPKGVDVYFDNVGGDILDAVLTRLSAARGLSSAARFRSTTNPRQSRGRRITFSLVINRASMKGFIVFDFADRYGEATPQMAGWLAAGNLKSREDVVRGLETFPDTFLKLFKGENHGKLVLQVADS